MEQTPRFTQASQGYHPSTIITLVRVQQIEKASVTVPEQYFQNDFPVLPQNCGTDFQIDQRLQKVHMLCGEVGCRFDQWRSGVAGKDTGRLFEKFQHASEDGLDFQ